MFDCANIFHTVFLPLVCAISLFVTALSFVSCGNVPRAKLLEIFCRSVIEDYMLCTSGC